MLAFLSYKAASFFAKKKYIPNEFIKVAAYGIEIILSTLIGILVIFAIGFVFGALLESLVFTICFVTIRQIVGGYHADTNFRCTLFLAVSYTIILLLYEGVQGIDNMPLIFFSSSFTLLTTVVFAPVENPNKIIEESQIPILKKASIIATLIFLAIAYILRHLELPIHMMVHLSLMFSSLLLVLGFLKNLFKTRV